MVANNQELLVPLAKQTYNNNSNANCNINNNKNFKSKFLTPLNLNDFDKR
jgi:hypothetical protein